MKKLFFLFLAQVALGSLEAAPLKLDWFIAMDTIPARDTSMKDYISMQANQMILIQNNKVSRMKADMTMKNGTVVKTDGTVKTKDGQRFQLREGDRIYLNGFLEGLEKSRID